MKPIKATLFALAFVSPVVLGNALVHAQSPGEDFEWMAATPGGIRIGASGNEGEEPTEDTLEFTGGCGGVMFQGEGGVVSTKSLVVGAYQLNGQVYDGGTVVMMAEPEGEGEPGTAMMSMGGDVGMAACTVESWLEGVEIQAGITCTPEGDVIVDLGGSPGESMQQEMQEEQKEATLFRRIIDWLGRKATQ